MPPTELSPRDLEDLAALERAVIAADGGRLKLEWHYLREGRAITLARRVGDRLIGYLGLYAFGGAPHVELVGMVDPDHRRAGTATDLLAEALELCAQEGFTHRLMVVPRNSPAGAPFARAHGGVLDHSEHSLWLAGAPHRVAEDPAVTLRRAVDADRPDLIRILTAGFGPPPPSMLENLADDRAETVMVDRAGATVGTLRISLEDGEGGIFGFAIDPEYRGRGIGRDVLGRSCAGLLGRGAAGVRLEVEVENDAALHLYTSTGFVPRSTEDYFLLPD